ncbi:MATE family efflux transporter [uncultured Erythrobacter sp.]|uniref:MATE family efflux transporter n=1 Tax=uncultured Erythrobacter sp. TaxID=263913 RepID=UPI00265B5D5D|nr:MATE family efflux transporter [uncultured Erythrobacter sp.]
MQQTRTLQTPSWGQELRATLGLAVPLAATNLLQMLIHAVDVVFIARLGDQPLAASSLAIAIFGLTVWAMTGLIGACAPLIAAERGRKLHSVREVRRTVRMGMWAAVGFGLVGMAVCFGGEALLLASGQDPQIAAMAGDFLAILSWAMIPMVLAGVFRIFVAALGKPGYATTITLLALGTNVLGNWALVFGNLGLPALGLMGSALSSVITALAMLVAYVFVIRRDRSLRRYRIFGRWWRPEWTRLKQIMVIGTPIALTVMAEAGLFSGAALLMGRIGETELAAHTLALNLAALAFQIPFGTAQAATIRVGYHHGAGDRIAAGRAGWVSIGIGTGFMTTTALAMMLMPTMLLRVYIDPAVPANAALVAFALQYLTLAAIFQLADGVQAVAAGALRGLQDTRVPMWIAIFSYWVPGFGCAIGLGFYTSLEGTGVWIGLATGLFFAAAGLLWRWARRDALGLTRYGTAA